MRAGRELRRAVCTHLIREVTLIEGRAFDRAVRENVHPYVTLGPSYWTDDSAECIRGRTITLQVDVWCSGGPAAGKANAEDVVDDVATALDGWADTEVLTMHPARVTMVRVMDDPNGAVHGVVQIELDVEDG